MSAEAHGGEARAEILARLRQARAHAGVVVSQTAPRGEDMAGGGGADTPLMAAGEEPADAATVALFTERLAALGVGVHHVAAGEDLPRVLASALWGERTRRIVVPRDVSPLWLGELDGVWVMRDDPDAAPLNARAVAAADAAVTRCAAAVAESGTLLLDGRLGQGRRALALLVDYHLCVVEAAQIVGCLADGLARLDPTRPTTWITGPTATTAIGGAKVTGMHGPRRMDVVVVG